MTGLLVYCLVFSYSIHIARACPVSGGGRGYLVMGDSNPVTFGGTATFTCSYHPESREEINRIFWSAGYPVEELVLVPGTNKTSCIVERIAPTLANYTLEYTCDLDNLRFTMGVVGVTENDIGRDKWWCCEVQHSQFCFHGYKCGRINAGRAPTLRTTTRVENSTPMGPETNTSQQKPSHATGSRLSTTFWVVLSTGLVALVAGGVAIECYLSRHCRKHT